MYCNNQTLIHKKSGKLFLIKPSRKDRSAYLRGRILRTVGEDGEVFKAHQDEFTCVEDFFGRPVHEISDNLNRPNVNLKRFIGSAEFRETAREEAALAWESRVMLELEMETAEEVRSPFSDGSFCWWFANWFLQRRSAEPLYSYRGLSGAVVSGPRVFRFAGKLWLYDGPGIGCSLKVIFDLNHILLTTKPNQHQLVKSNEHRTLHPPLASR